MPILPSRRRSAGNSRLRRGRQNSHSATASKLPTSTRRVNGTSSRFLVPHHAELRLAPASAPTFHSGGQVLVENPGSPADRSVSPSVAIA